MNTSSQLRSRESVVQAYVVWREACRHVSDAYGFWASQTGLDARLAFGSYLAALDREESAAQVYAACSGR